MHAFKIKNILLFMKTDQKCWYILLSRCSESIPPSKANGKAYDESFDTAFTFSVSEGKNVNTGQRTTLIKRSHGVFKKWTRTATGVPLRNNRCVTFLTATIIVASHHIVMVQWKERPNGPRKECSSSISHSTWQLSKRKLCLNKIFFFPAQPQKDK